MNPLLAEMRQPVYAKFPATSMAHYKGRILVVCDASPIDTAIKRSGATKLQRSIPKTTGILLDTPNGTKAPVTILGA